MLLQVIFHDWNITKISSFAPKKFKFLETNGCAVQIDRARFVLFAKKEKSESVWIIATRDNKWPFVPSLRLVLHVANAFVCNPRHYEWLKPCVSENKSTECTWWVWLFLHDRNGKIVICVSRDHFIYIKKLSNTILCKHGLFIWWCGPISWALKI